MSLTRREQVALGIMILAVLLIGLIAFGWITGLVGFGFGPMGAGMMV